MSEKHNSLYLISGIVIGVVLGLLYSIILDPVNFVDTIPNSLSEQYKSSYRILVARAYQSNGDLGRAQERLALLSDNSSVGMLAYQAQNILSSGGNSDHARHLAVLANDLDTGESSMHMSENLSSDDLQANTINNSGTDNGESSTVVNDNMLESTVEPERTFTPRVTATSIPTLSSPFQMEYREIICESDLPQRLLQIEVLNNNGKPVPGIKVEVAWQEGNDYFYTGLYPEINPGYADFEMQADTTYSLRIENSSEVIDDIEAPLCKASSGEDYYGGWWYRFIQ